MRQKRVRERGDRGIKKRKSVETGNQERERERVKMGMSKERESGETGKSKERESGDEPAKRLRWQSEGETEKAKRECIHNKDREKR